MKLYFIATLVAIFIVAVFERLSKMNIVTNSVANTAVVKSDMPSKIAITISGQIKKPGSYELDSLASLRNLIEAAGGVLSQADDRCYNLDLILEDKESYYIAAFAENKVSINKATAIEFTTLPGIGITYAQRLVEYRELYGEFQRLEDVKKISGIGDATFSKIKDLICL